MPYISSANIACGFHAGDEKIIEQTIDLALKNNVAIGAHPSFFDRENFGRTEMELPLDQIYDLVILQLRTIDGLAKKHDTKLHHVKPHGALYNMSAKNPEIAATIARAVKDFDEHLVLFGLSGSHSIDEAARIGLKMASEVFADRTYQDDGSLTSRTHPDALIGDIYLMVSQLLQMINEKNVTSLNQKRIPVIADTICIHGDGPHAIDFARQIYQQLKQNHIDIKAI
ncbi:MAG TPA: 5-oxoprolinase subunit PxpA [Chitinophagaceae bacterium]